MKKILLVLVGESGSGKTSIAYELQDRYGLKVLESYTTRPRRPDEHTGRDNHTFISEQEYSELTGIVAETLYHGYHYCATEQQIEESDIYIVDPEGIEYFDKHYKGDKRVIKIHIMLDEETRALRMLARGSSQDLVNSRIENDRISFKDIYGSETKNGLADFGIKNNGTMNETIGKLMQALAYIMICEKE